MESGEMDRSPDQHAVKHPEGGVALVTVLVVLASIALLMSGVYSLVSEGTRSARENVHFQTTRSLSANGVKQAASVIDSVCRLGFFPDAPPGSGVNLGNKGQGPGWNSREQFAEYLRGSGERPDDPNSSGKLECLQTNPDIYYQDPNTGIEVRACVHHRGKSTLAGSGAGPVFTKGAQGKEAIQNLFDITVWASGSAEVTGQYQAAARYFTSN